MNMFYTKKPTKAFHGASTDVSFNILAIGQAREVLNMIDGWLVFKEGNAFRFVRAEEVLHQPIPVIPADLEERISNIETWGRGIGYKS